MFPSRKSTKLLIFARGLYPMRVFLIELSCFRAVESQDVGSEEIESQAMELLEQMSLFWVAKSLEAASLEKILQEHLSVYGRPLCQIMFRYIIVD